MPSVISPKRDSWSAFIAWPGSSAQARWLITRRGPAGSTMSRTAAHSAGSIPSRFMPVSSWTPKGWPGSASKWRVSWSSEFSIGVEPVLGDDVGVAGHVAREDEDVGAGAERGADGRAFLGHRHEEGAGAGAGERAGHAGGAEAVGVGLHDGAGFGALAGGGVERAPVGHDRVEIDGECRRSHGLPR